MQLNRKELYPGIHLNYLPDSRFKTNYISISFLTDMTGENAAPSHLLPMVLGRGSAAYPTLGAINRALELVWDGTLDSGTGRLGESRPIGFSACYPDDRFLPGGENVEQRTLDIFFDIMLNPLTQEGAFSPSYVESEKEKLCQRIDTAINSKGKYATRRATEELCHAEPYGIPSVGTKEQVIAISPKSLFDYYREMLSTFPIEIFYIGRTGFSEIENTMKQRLATLFCPKKSLAGTMVIRHADRVRRVEENQSGKQGRLCLGFRTGITLSDQEFPAFVLMNEILGTSPISKLFTEVREKQSLCYYCSAIPDSLKGILMISSGIRDENRMKAEDSILAQVNAMKAGDFTEAEILAAYNSIESALKGLSDGRSTVESFVLRRLLAGCDTDPEHYRSALKAVRKDDIVAAAKRLCLDTVYYLKPDGHDNESTGGEEQDD